MIKSRTQQHPEIRCSHHFPSGCVSVLENHCPLFIAYVLFVSGCHNVILVRSIQTIECSHRLFLLIAVCCLLCECIAIHSFIHYTIGEHLDSFCCEVKVQQNNTSYQSYQLYFSFEENKNVYGELHLVPGTYKVFYILCLL